MYLKYQVPCGKTEPGEMGIDAAYRETAEETNLLINKGRLLYLANDPTFDCDIYYAKLKEGEIPERTEPHNMGSWLYYPWITWYDMATRRQMTPTLTTFKDAIDNMVRMS